MQTVISRHLETVHKDVDEVKRFAILPKNNPERTQLIDLLRKKGNHLYNTSSDYNKDGKLLVARRPKQERPGTQYTPCHNCHVSLSKKSIRRHRQKCVGASTKGDRANTILSRRTDGRIHANASKQLQRIFAVFNDDLVVQLIRYDELLIEFGNGMAEKYKKDQQQAMIRNRLRTLGRLLEEMKKCRLNAEPKITDFASIYDPGLYDCMLRAVNTLARFNEETGEHEVPSIVTSLGTYIKAVAEVALLVVRKKKDREKQLLLEDYIFIHDKQYSTKINRVAHESQAKKKRQQKKVLPSTDEIKKLQDYVVIKREKAFVQLSERYTYSAWLELAKTTLISIQIFTRRRAGELERTTISDLKNAETVDENTNPEIYGSLSEDEKKYAGQYTRFIITGKLGRDVPVLLDSKMRDCLDLILRYRSSTKITPKNPYVFGIPGFVDGRFKYLRACDLMREYSQECGVQHPERLRGTSLRKHMATVCAARNMDENKVVDIANYMGHAETIHRSHYRQSVVTRDVVQVARILRSAMGQGENVVAGDDHTDDNQNFEVRTSEEKQNKNTNANTELLAVEAVKSNKKKKVLVPDSESGSSDEYEPNEETENDDDCDEDDIEEDEPAPKRRKKTNSTKNKSSTSRVDLSKKRKLRWTPEEKVAAATAFENGIKNGKLPSTAAMKKFLKDNPQVHRTVAQIRTWASNEKKKYQRG
ncbi:uncharacterized protein [Venturia canescens]|uniref:uncharacterized protein n=1 Tax=Venturia canescens TaxID=32260 RepID=UPI001C9C5F22|nr:uncharacterized protein LOC122415805 [Venturia canescens]